MRASYDDTGRFALALQASTIARLWVKTLLSVPHLIFPYVSSNSLTVLKSIVAVDDTNSVGLCG